LSTFYALLLGNREVRPLVSPCLSIRLLLHTERFGSHLQYCLQISYRGFDEIMSINNSFVKTGEKELTWRPTYISDENSPFTGEV
jgi:hypothetical protein